MCSKANNTFNVRYFSCIAKYRSSCTCKHSKFFILEYTLVNSEKFITLFYCYKKVFMKFLNPFSNFSLMYNFLIFLLIVSEPLCIFRIRRSCNSQVLTHQTYKHNFHLSFTWSVDRMDGQVETLVRIRKSHPSGQTFGQIKTQPSRKTGRCIHWRNILQLPFAK